MKSSTKDILGRIPPRNWLFAVLAAVGLVLVPAVFWALQEIRREDTPERYGRLCELLLPSLGAEKERVVKRTEAEQVLAFEELREDLGRLAQDCRDLAPIAREANLQLTEALQLAKTAKGPGGLVMAGVETAVGLTLRSDGIIESGSKDLFDELKRYLDLYEELKAIRHRLEVQRVKLALAAPRFSGPVSNGTLLSFQFTEERPGLARRLLGEVRSMDQTQTLWLGNASGQELTRCVIVVRLITTSGDSFLHQYYVGAWAKGERRTVNYSPTALFAETDTAVARVQVTLHARELSSSITELKREGETWPYSP